MCLSSLPNSLTHVVELVQSGLDDVEDVSKPVSAVARKALRVARLRSDWHAVLWLQCELRAPQDEEAKRRVALEVAPHLPTEEFRAAWHRTTEDYLARRTISSDKMLGQALGEAEAAIASLREHAAGLQPPPGLHTPDLYFEGQRLENQRADLILAISEREQILARVRSRIGDYLSEVERQLFFGQVNADVWERNRTYVDLKLEQVAPHAAGQFAAAYRRQAEGDAEARSHALTSCRRVLKSLADALLPATNDLLEGADGVERRMTDDKFVVRLCQFVTEALRGALRDLLVQQVREIAQRLDALNALSSKGVHADVSADEVDRCLIHTYLLAGDLLRLADGDSGVLDPLMTDTPGT